MEKMQLQQAHLFPNFLHRPLHQTVWTHLEFQFMTTVFVSMATRSSNLDDQKCWIYPPDWGPHPHLTKQLKQPWRSRGIWDCPIPITIPVSGEESWPPWDPLLVGNTGDLHRRWDSNSTTISCMAGTNCERNGVRWQRWPNRSCSDRPRLSHPVLCVAFITRRTELGQGMICHIYAVRCYQIGCQTSPTHCQDSKPGWWPLTDHPGPHWRTHQTKGAQSFLINPTCFNTIQFL